MDIGGATVEEAAKKRDAWRCRGVGMALCRELKIRRSGNRNRSESNDAHDNDLVGLRRKNLGVPDKRADVDVA
jgi:hypothetical protein